MANLTRLVVSAIFLMMSFSSGYSQIAKITIDKIDENGSISGHVTGLDETTAKGYRVVVYVHTDIWYIHPYAGQGEGQSWASIGDNGVWSIPTVKRDFFADKVSALIVGENYNFPDRTPSLKEVKNIGAITKQLKGTPDYGKL